MKASVYKPTLTTEQLSHIASLKKTGLLNEKQQKKVDVLTMTHSGEKREIISEKLGINMDTITEWKKLFTKQGLEVYLGLKKTVALVKKTAIATTKKVGTTIKNLEKKVSQKTGTPATVLTKKESSPKPSLDTLEAYIVNVLTKSYESVATAIQTYSISHGTDTKKKIIKTYKAELKKAKKLIQEWTKKVEDLKHQLKKQEKKETKAKKKK